MGCAGTRSTGIVAATTGCCNTRTACIRMVGAAAAGANYPAAACIAAALGHGPAAAAIVSATAVTEPMAAPAVAITPAGPWAHAQEDAVVEISRPVKAIGCAGVRRIVIIAV
jgi:hypothetical protein